MKKIGLPLRFGFIISAVLVAYFLVLSLFNKHINPAYSFVNAAITAFGIFETVRYYKLVQGNHFSYSKGIIAGFIAGFVATTVFSIFFLIYITEINPDFLTEMLEIVNVGYNASVGLVAFTVFIMGLATSVISAFTVMQYFKNSWNVS